MCLTSPTKACWYIIPDQGVGLVNGRQQGICRFCGEARWFRAHTPTAQQDEGWTSYPLKMNVRPTLQ